MLFGVCCVSIFDDVGDYVFRASSGQSASNRPQTYFDAVSRHDEGAAAHCAFNVHLFSVYCKGPSQTAAELVQDINKSVEVSVRLQRSSTSCDIVLFCQMISPNVTVQDQGVVTKERNPNTNRLNIEGHYAECYPG